MMSDGDENRSTKEGLAAGMRRLVEQVLPDKWSARLGLVRGLFLKDTGDQWRRLMLVARHFQAYRTIDRALFYHRFAANILLCHSLGIFDALREGALSVDEVADRCSIESGATHQLLRILESQQLLERRGDDFEMGDFASEFFDPHSLVSMVPMLDVCETYAQVFPDFVDAAQGGTTPAMLDIFDESGRTDALLEGVNYYLDQAVRELIARVDWPPIRHFIVGSMGVSFSALVMSEFADARVTYGCLPHLVERIPRLRRRYEVPADRVDEMHDHGGDPAGDRWGREAFDLVFLTKKMILDPAQGLGERFADKAYEVLNPGGVTVFWETIYDDDEATPVDRAMEGFLDFGVSPTGPVLTRRRFRRRLEEIGFCDVHVVECLEGATTFVVARK